MLRTVLVFGAAAMLTAPAYGQITYGQSVPVQLEANEGLDPCALGRIYDVGDDSSAMVFAGPDSEYPVVNYLSDDDLVWVCQSEGDYVGVVFSSDDDIDCELSSPSEFTVNYSGPCDTGWVKSDWVEIIAG